MRIRLVYKKVIKKYSVCANNFSSFDSYVSSREKSQDKSEKNDGF